MISNGVCDQYLVPFKGWGYMRIAPQMLINYSNIPLFRTGAMPLSELRLFVWLSKFGQMSCRTVCRYLILSEFILTGPQY
jgi:hypothetical protein